jgi:hypothetical protein
MSSKTLEQICNETLNAIKTPESVYANKCATWSSVLNGRYYYDIVSEKLCEKFNELNGIQLKDRKKGYIDQHGDNLKRVDKKSSNRKEERMIIEWVGNDIGELGVVYDYQVPLKNTYADKAGKIDFISYDINNIYLTEFKLASKENLLRAVLEIFTYSKIMNVERLLNEMSEKEIKNKKVVKTVLFDKESKMYTQYLDLNKAPNLKILIEKLDVKIFVLEDLSFKTKKI